ncbi:MAG: hypothetical protein Q7R52_01105 [archaeon]|nr:hypothetical protein [archaeon]
MKRGIWITIIVIVAIILAYVLFSVYQGTQLQNSLNKVSVNDITTDAKELANGNCSKIADIDNTLKEIKSSCQNPALKYIIENKGAEMGQENICEEINNQDNEYIVKLEKLKKDCNYE